MSAWLARRGARPTGVDSRLRSSRPRGRRSGFGLEFPLIEADAAEPGLPDGSADLLVSEYGASIWVDPYRWIPEAARYSGPGGGSSSCATRRSSSSARPTATSQPASTVRPQFGLYRVDWPAGVEFHLAHGDWIRVLRDNGFEILHLVELQAPTELPQHEYYDFVSADWGRKWPAEEIWRARKA